MYLLWWLVNMSLDQSRNPILHTALFAHMPMFCVFNRNLIEHRCCAKHKKCFMQNVNLAKCRLTIPLVVSWWTHNDNLRNSGALTQLGLHVAGYFEHTKEYISSKPSQMSISIRSVSIVALLTVYQIFKSVLCNVLKVGFLSYRNWRKEKNPQVLAVKQCSTILILKHTLKTSLRSIHHVSMMTFNPSLRRAALLNT